MPDKRADEISVLITFPCARVGEPSHMRRGLSGRFPRGRLGDAKTEVVKSDSTPFEALKRWLLCLSVIFPAFAFSNHQSVLTSTFSKSNRDHDKADQFRCDKSGGGANHKPPVHKWKSVIQRFRFSKSSERLFCLR